MVGADGRTVWVRDTAVPIPDESGRVDFWHGVVHDITGPKRIEHELREAEAKYRALVENLPAVIYQVAPDDDRRTMYVSPHVETALGYSRQEWLDQPDIWMELLHPDDREPTLAAHDLHNETGRPWRREYRLIASDGRAVWFRDEATLVREEDGRPAHWLGVQLDITELKRVEAELRAARDELGRRVAARTAELEEANALMALEIGERRRAEAELRTAEHRYRMLAERIPAVTYVWQVNVPDDAEPEGYTSPMIEQLLGYTVAEWRSSASFWISRLHPDDRNRVLEAALRSESTGEPFSIEYRYLHKDGHIVWVADRATLLSRDEYARPHLFQGVMIDVTARKLAEAKAAQTERERLAADRRYRTLIEAIPAITYVEHATPEAPEESRFSYVSPQVEDILGYTPEEATADPHFFDRTLHPDDRDRIRAANVRCEETGEPFDEEFRQITKDGRVRWIHDRAVLVRDEAGTPLFWHGVTLDITARKEAEQGLRLLEERYRTLVEQIPAITTIEALGAPPDETWFTYVSPQVAEILGYTADEVLEDPNHIARMVHPDDRDRVYAANTRCDETGEPFDEEFRVVRPDGRIVWLHSRAVLVRNDDGEPMFWHGVALDVTEHRELETRYRQLAGNRPDDRPE
jgi:PAS domain S-box-containing protein